MLWRESVLMDWVIRLEFEGGCGCDRHDASIDGFVLWKGECAHGGHTCLLYQDFLVFPCIVLNLCGLPNCKCSTFI